MKHRARKRFGQNFLNNPGIINRMVETIAPRAEDNIVEIGPGLGALTRPLLERCGRLQAVELDRDLPAKLRAHCAGAGELLIHEGDALTFSFSKLRAGDQRLRVVGNLPYNISTPLIFHLLEDIDAIEDMHFTLQKEVVDRLAAAPHTKAYGRLSVIVQYYCQVDSLFTIPPGAFRPVPKVDSAFVRLKPRRGIERMQVSDEALFARVVTQAFSQRRKTLRNTLKGLASESQLKASAIDPGARAEQIDLAGFIRLADALAVRADTGA
ncbi:16S rRNA (adenine(1518)-N(6)/adenine(1519)-N(6))-dimethyltransferase [Alkalilimnicola ehrlichii]|uniref:Ribosomal RNA small subunit methyltransferase A n=1 Tax=Alkalilimnicola ehrlichii TaxID=351052 RepID=A0A3E0X1C3_9GAMM|nr:16S rRNA (adenine(1518)-N(6)/adenine(1519)-N(6))-dimethyltransferase RsmA [Alkalilimnicola ehrlichii]RFA31272.1 16S rRNA (adenine(1518)-N(6)/adenine(1519)-N(6))-dimethyltransferase [Alkalilimnicola ehrlichii]RFA39453.1 16S rRNA (adenine(1518)-N(6)/adenine(1519)-N(6))-dimethyltransferase [Alkalilimnicola ehrlichii]